MKLRQMHLQYFEVERCERALVAGTLGEVLLESGHLTFDILLYI